GGGFGVADEQGNVYVSGGFHGTVDFDPGPGVYSQTSVGGYYDVFVWKLDSSGSFAWARQMGGSGTDAGTRPAIDGRGHVYTTGYFSGTADFDPGPDTYNLVSAGGTDAFLSQLRDQA